MQPRKLDCYEDNDRSSTAQQFFKLGFFFYKERTKGNVYWLSAKLSNGRSKRNTFN